MNLKKLSKISDSAENKTLLAVQKAIETSPKPMAGKEDMGGYVEAKEEEGGIMIEETFGVMSAKLKRQVEAILKADGYSEVDSDSNHDTQYTFWAKE